MTVSTLSKTDCIRSGLAKLGPDRCALALAGFDREFRRAWSTGWTIEYERGFFCYLEKRPDVDFDEQCGSREPASYVAARYGLTLDEYDAIGEAWTWTASKDGELYQLVKAQASEMPDPDDGGCWKCDNPACMHNRGALLARVYGDVYYIPEDDRWEI